VSIFFRNEFFLNTSSQKLISKHLASVISRTFVVKVCENETEKNQILVDLEKRSLDETLCIQYQNTLLEQIAKETPLEEVRLVNKC
jgi:hypothetical protein